MMNLAPLLVSEAPSGSLAQRPSSSVLDLDRQVRETISRVIRRSVKSREELAADMSQRLGREVTAVMLNNFTAESKQAARFPAAWVTTFCEATGNDELQRLVIGERMRQLLELGEATARLLAGGRVHLCRPGATADGR